MVRVGEVQHCIAKDHLQLCVFACKHSGKRIVTGFHYDTVSGPLPELTLGRPKLSAVVTDNEGVALPFLPFPVFHVFKGSFSTHDTVLSSFPPCGDRQV